MAGNATERISSGSGGGGSSGSGSGSSSKTAAVHRFVLLSAAV